MLAFFRGTSLVSRLIKWRTWGLYSHVGWVERDGTIRESWHKPDPVTGHNGPRKGLIGDLHVHGTVIDLFSVAMDGADHAALIAYMDDCIRRGIRYDMRGVLGGFLLRRDQSEDDGFMFCSDYMADAFNRIGRPLLARVPSWQVSPSDLSRSPLLKPVGTFVAGENWFDKEAPWKT